jgi:hypothetical protein
MHCIQLQYVRIASSRVRFECIFAVDGWQVRSGQVRSVGVRLRLRMRRRMTAFDRTSRRSMLTLALRLRRPYALVSTSGMNGATSAWARAWRTLFFAQVSIRWVVLTSWPSCKG